MTIHFEIPSLEARKASLTQEQNQKFEETVLQWLTALSRGLPLQKGETVWFKVYWDRVSYERGDYVIAEATRIYREKGYYVRPLYSSYRCDWDLVSEFTAFEMAELDPANPKHNKSQRPAIFERILCRMQYRLGVSRPGRRYDPY